MTGERILFMKNEERLVAGGYLFGNEEDAKMAKDEQKTIDYLESKLNYDKVNSVLKIYERAIEERIFRTPVGFEFLKKVRQELMQRGVSEESIRPIPMYLVFSNTEVVRPVRIYQVKEKEDNTKEYLRTSLWFNIALVILVIAMFAITYLGETTNMMNYRFKLENKYAAWEQQLDEREAEIRVKEKELGIQ